MFSEKLAFDAVPFFCFLKTFCFNCHVQCTLDYIEFKCELKGGNYLNNMLFFGKSKEAKKNRLKKFCDENSLSEILHVKQSTLKGEWRNKKYHELTESYLNNK